MKLPFHKKPRVDIVPVGNENTGTLYFKKIWGRTGTERAFVDELEFNQGKTQLKLLKLARKIAKDEKKDPNEVLEIIGTNSEDPILLNYLEEIQELLELRSEERNFRDKIVTLMINERLAYPVNFPVGATKGNQVLAVESSGLEQGTKIKVGHNILELSKPLINDSTEITLVSKLVYDIELNSVGFLVNNQDNYIFGDKDWKLEDTQVCDQMSEQLKDLIFEFYQLESIGGELPSSPKKEPSMNESKTLKSTPQETQQTGKNSATNSSATESQQKDSTKILETV